MKVKNRVCLNYKSINKTELKTDAWNPETIVKLRKL